MRHGRAGDLRDKARQAVDRDDFVEAYLDRPAKVGSRESYCVLEVDVETEKRVDLFAVASDSCHVPVGRRRHLRVGQSDDPGKRRFAGLATMRTT